MGSAVGLAVVIVVVVVVAAVVVAAVLLVVVVVVAVSHVHWAPAMGLEVGCEMFVEHIA